MSATEAEDRAAVRKDRTQPRLLLAHRLTPARDRAVVRTLLHTLSIAFAEAELGTPVEAPIDVQFRQAQFHLRELRAHPWGRDGTAHDIGGPQPRALPDGRHQGGQAVGMELAVLVSHLTAALAEHAAWYGARCVGLDALVSVERHYGMLVQPAQPPEVGALTVQGWRSVSVVCPPYGMVLYAADGAPAFLRLVSGRLVRHGDTCDTRCDRVKRGPCSA
jgi:putative endonuclease (uncharacterized protein DUF1780)